MVFPINTLCADIFIQTTLKKAKKIGSEEPILISNYNVT